MEALDELRAQLEAAGKKYARSSERMEADKKVVKDLLAICLRAGMSPTDAQRLSHLSSETVRITRIAAGLPPAPRGGRRQ